MKINSLCFNEMLKYCTPLQIKKQVEANMHCSQVVFAPDKQKLPLELKDDENKLLSYPCVYRWLVPEDKAVSILGDECLLNKLEKKEINGTAHWPFPTRGSERHVGRSLRGIGTARWPFPTWV